MFILSRRLLLPFYLFSQYSSWSRASSLSFSTTSPSNWKWNTNWSTVSSVLKARSLNEYFVKLWGAKGLFAFKVFIIVASFSSAVIYSWSNPCWLFWSKFIRSLSWSIFSEAPSSSMTPVFPRFFLSALVGCKILLSWKCYLLSCFKCGFRRHLWNLIFKLLINSKF